MGLGAGSKHEVPATPDCADWKTNLHYFQKVEVKADFPHEDVYGLFTGALMILTTQVTFT